MSSDVLSTLAATSVRTPRSWSYRVSGFRQDACSVLQTQLHFAFTPQCLIRVKHPTKPLEITEEEEDTVTTLRWPAGRSREDLEYSVPQAAGWQGDWGSGLEVDMPSDLPPGPQVSSRGLLPPVRGFHPWRGPGAASQAQMWGAFEGWVWHEDFLGHCGSESWPPLRAPSWRSALAPGGGRRG